jgi:hypothetical protein
MLIIWWHFNNPTIVFYILFLENYIRFIKIGGGEMTFRIVNFCRMKEVIRNGGQPFSFTFKDPLLVLNNFGENGQVKMIGKSLQEMFPALCIERVDLQKLKRVISFTYQPNKKFIYFRHYKIVINEGGVSSTFQKLMTQPKTDLSEFKSIK